jgi:hypothetical protein
MNKNFWILIAVILAFTAIDADAQRWKLRRYEVDFGFSVVPFYGDIGLANKPFLNAFNGLRPSIGVTPRFMIAKNMAVSLDLSFLMFGGKDEAGSSHGRVLSFNTMAFQHFARFEYFLLGEVGGIGGGIYNRNGMVNNYNRVYLYVYGGAGGILSSAKVKNLNDNNNIAQVDYPGYYPGAQYGFGFPVGAGLKFSIDPRWNIGVEMGYTFTTTDLLDGYASSYSKHDDSYYLITLKATYRIRNDKNGRPIFNKYYR